MEIVTSRLSEYYESLGILSEELCGFRLARSKVDMLLVVRRLQELGRERNTPLYMCIIDLQKRTTLSTESCCGRYSHALACQPRCFQSFASSMTVCGLASVQIMARTQNRLMSCRDYLGRVLSPLLSNMFFVAAIHLVRLREGEGIVKD